MIKCSHKARYLIKRFERDVAKIKLDKFRNNAVSFSDYPELTITFVSRHNTHTILLAYRSYYLKHNYSCFQCSIAITNIFI